MVGEAVDQAIQAALGKTAFQSLKARLIVDEGPAFVTGD